MAPKTQKVCAYVINKWVRHFYVVKKIVEYFDNCVLFLKAIKIGETHRAQHFSSCCENRLSHLSVSNASTSPPDTIVPGTWMVRNK